MTATAAALVSSLPLGWRRALHRLAVVFCGSFPFGLGLYGNGHRLLLAPAVSRVSSSTGWKGRRKNALLLSARTTTCLLIHLPSPPQSAPDPYWRLDKRKAGMSGDKPRYRGFTLTHQKAVFDVDLASGLLVGFTELTLVPTSPELKVIYLNFRQGIVKSVSLSTSSSSHGGPEGVGSTKEAVAFAHVDPLANLGLTSPEDVHTFPEVKRKAFSAYTEGEGGELAIRVEDGWVELVKKEMEPGAVVEGGGEGNAGEKKPAEGEPTTFVPLTVKIEFEVRAGGEGLAMFGGREGELDDEDDLVRPSTVPHVYRLGSLCLEADSNTSPDTAAHPSHLHFPNLARRCPLLDPLRRQLVGEMHVGTRLCRREEAGRKWEGDLGRRDEEEREGEGKTEAGLERRRGGRRG
jgi:hypothetical protein